MNSMVEEEEAGGRTSLFLMPVLDWPPPPPSTSSFGETNVEEYTGNAGRVCDVCLVRMDKIFEVSPE